VTKKEIKLGKWSFLCEFMKNGGKDFNDPTLKKSFVIIRDFDMYDTVVYDKSILVVEKSLYEKMVSNADGDFAFPLGTKSNIHYTNLVEKFSTYSFSDARDLAFSILDSQTMEDASILCDKIRVWWPVNKKRVDFIVHAYSYVNDIHFHWVCESSKIVERVCDHEVRVGMNKYLEHIDLVVPSIDCLMLPANNYCINDVMSEISNGFNPKERQLADWLVDNSQDESSTVMMLADFIRPYAIKKTTEEVDDGIDGDGNAKKRKVDHLMKVFIREDSTTMASQYINNSMNISLFPYSGISSNEYVLEDGMLPSMLFSSHENSLRLSAKLGFDNKRVALVNEFLFPGKEEDQHEYDEQKHGPIADKIARQVTEYYKMFYVKDEYDYESDEMFGDESEAVNSIKQTGFVIQIANDTKFDDPIYESKIDTESPSDCFIYDFSFSLDGLVSSLEEIPETLVMRSLFIDKSLGIAISSNPVVLTKEWMKLMVNDTPTPAIWVSRQNDLTRESYMRVKNGYNFIDKVNCVISEDEDTMLARKMRSIAESISSMQLGEISSIPELDIDIEEALDDNSPENVDVTLKLNDIVKINESIKKMNDMKESLDAISRMIVENDKKNSFVDRASSDMITKIVYKPIFYKTQDLQNITLRKSTSQNIGINLSQYMNKVQVFTMKIGETVVKESSRNDAFVIFKIDANTLDSDGGTYTIMDEDFEYISSGNYSIY